MVFRFSEATGFVDDGESIDDMEYNDIKEEDSVEEEAAAAPLRKPKSTRKSAKGRMLKRWDADEDQLLLLYCDYVCTQMGTPMPWDAIAATMEPRDPASGKLPMTGEAIKQHLAKLRVHRVNEGFRVPPPLDRAARRQATNNFARVTGTTAMKTPAATPRKNFASFTTPATDKAPVKQKTEKTDTPKQSTLLANVNKTKQKKAEQTKRAQMGNTTENAAASRNIIGGFKAITGKRCRKPKAADQDYHDHLGISDPTPTRKLRPLDYKDYAHIKSEQDSDDDLPLSKKLHRKNRPGVGLMNDTVAMWNNREHNNADQTQPTTKKSAPKDSGMPISQIGKSNNNMTFETGQQRQKQQVDTGRAHNSNSNSNSTSTFPARQNFGATAPTSFEQSNNTFGNALGPSTFTQPRYVYGQEYQQGSGDDLADSQVAPTSGFTAQPANDFDIMAFTSSPAHDSSSSSNGFSSASYNPSWGLTHSITFSQRSSGTTSKTSSFSSDNLSDSFVMPSSNSSNNLAGLPRTDSDASMGFWLNNSSAFYALTPATTGSMCPDYFDYPNGNSLHSYQFQTQNTFDVPFPTDDTVKTSSLPGEDHTSDSMVAHALDTPLAPHVNRSEVEATLTQAASPNQLNPRSSQSFDLTVHSNEFGPDTDTLGNHSPDLSHYLKDMNDPFSAGMFNDDATSHGFGDEDIDYFAP